MKKTIFIIFVSLLISYTIEVCDNTCTDCDNTNCAQQSGCKFVDSTCVVKSCANDCGTCASQADCEGSAAGCKFDSTAKSWSAKVRCNNDCTQCTEQTECEASTAGCQYDSTVKNCSEVTCKGDGKNELEECKCGTNSKCKEGQTCDPNGEGKCSCPSAYTGKGNAEEAAYCLCGTDNICQKGQICDSDGKCKDADSSNSSSNKVFIIMLICSLAVLFKIWLN